MAGHAEKLTNSRRIVSGIGWNLLGRGLPALIAFAVTPLLVGEMGLERWGLFTLGLALIGMAGMLDLGIGTALTRALAERLGHGREEDAPGLIIAAGIIGGVVSLPVALLLWVGVPWLLDETLSVTPDLRDEAVVAFRILALAVPIIVASATLWGVLQAYQRFRAGNLINIPLNALYYVGPALALMVWTSLVPVMAILVLCRLGAVLGFGAVVLRLVPGLTHRPKLAREEFLPLLSMGGWNTVTNVVGPLMSFADRFIVGAMLSLVAVSFYATPLDLLLRFLMIPIAVATATMPAIAASCHAAPERARALLQRSTTMLFVVSVAGMAGVVAIAPELMRFWLGPEFAANSAHILQILAAGMLVSAVSTAPGNMLDAAGRFDLNAKSLLAQLPVIVPASVLLIWEFGIEGAAYAYVMRQVLNFVVRVAVAQRLLPAVFTVATPLLLLMTLAAAGLAFCAVLDGFLARMAMATMMILLLSVAGMVMMLGAEDRARITAALRRLPIPGIAPRVGRLGG